MDLTALENSIKNFANIVNGDDTSENKEDILDDLYEQIEFDFEFYNTHEDDFEKLGILHDKFKALNSQRKSSDIDNQEILNMMFPESNNGDFGDGFDMDDFFGLN